MKILRKLMLMLLCAAPMMAMAQTENPVKWKHSVADKGNGLYTVELRAEIGEGWHIYVTDPAYTLNPTTLEFTPGKGVTTEGELRSLSKAHLVKDEYGLTASGQEGYFENEALFVLTRMTAAEPRQHQLHALPCDLARAHGQRDGGANTAAAADDHKILLGRVQIQHILGRNTAVIKEIRATHADLLLGGEKALQGRI